jgi:autotransporter-associated beta strand protein
MNTDTSTAVLRTTRKVRTRAGKSNASLRRRILGASAISLLSLLAIPAAMAAPATFWKGQTDGSWSGLNWASDAAGTSTAATPTGADNVTFSITSGAANQGITTLDAGFTIRSLTINDLTPVVISTGTIGALSISGAAGTGITVNTGASLTLNANVRLNDPSDTIAVNGTGTAVINGLLDANVLIKTGTGTLTLTSSSNSQSFTQINAGRLVAANDGSLGLGGVVFSGGELLVSGATFATPKSIQIGAAATGRLSNSDTANAAVFGGGITLGAGSTLAIGSAGNTGIVRLSGTGSADATANVSVDFGTLQNGDASGFTQYTSVAQTTTVAAGATLDAGGFNSTILNLQGAGLLTSNPPAVVIEGGNLPLAPGIALIPVTYTIASGNFSGAINDGTTIVNNNAPVTGPGLDVVALVKSGTGGDVLTLTGVSNFSGGTQIQGGTLSFANGSLGTTGTIEFTGNATLQWNGTNTQDLSARLKLGDGVNAALDTNGNNVTFANGLQTGESQTAALTKLGDGTLTLGGTNTYSGGTTILQGTVSVATDGALGTGGITFYGGELLATGQGFFSSKSIVIGDEASGRLSNNNTGGLPAAGAGFNGGITLGTGSTLAIGSAGNTGIVTLRGIGSTNATTNVSVDFGTLQNGDANGFTQYTSVANTTTVAAGATLDAGGFDSAILNLQGAGTLTSNTPVLAVSNSDPFISLAPLPPPAVVTYTITSGNFSGAINDGEQVVTLQKVGAPDDLLTLTGVSNFSGGTEMNGGILSFANGSLSTVGEVFFSGTSTLRWEPGNTQDISSRLVLGNSINATFDTNGNNVTFANAFTFGSEGDGSAAITKAGAGTLTLLAPNTYTGGTTIRQGVLSFANDALGTVGTVDFAGNSTLRWEPGNTQDLSARLKIEDGVNATLDTNNNNVTLSNAIQLGASGTGALTKAGFGTLTLLGDNTYTGGTTILAATIPSGSIIGTLFFVPALQLGNGGTTGSIVGNVVDNGMLIFNRSDDITFPGIISGTGAVTKAGAGMLTLLGDNTYTGETMPFTDVTTILAGVLQLGNGGTSGSIVGNVTDNASLIFNRSDDITFPGIISGTGTVTKEGAGKLTILGANTYQGGTAIHTGVLFLGDGSTPGAALGTGDVTVNISATFQLDLANGETFANTILNSGHVVADDAPGNNYTISGLITGTGDFTKTGTNTVTLSHVNDYTGNTYVYQGTLSAGAGTPGGPGASGPGPFGQNSAVFVNSGGTLQLNGFDVSIATLVGNPGGIVQNGSATPATLTLAGNPGPGYFNGIIQDGNASAPLSLWMAGSGVQTLAGLNTYTGTTHVTNGRLTAGVSNPDGGPGAFGNNSAVTVDGPGILQTSGHTVAIGSLAGDAGGIVENAGYQPGNLITGANNSSTTFAGVIRDGVAQLAIYTGSEQSVEPQAQLDVIYPSYASPLSLTKTGTGTQTLTGTNTYTGGTTILGGALQLGNGGTSGSIVGNVTDNALLIFNRSDDITFPGIISGTGAVTKDGAGKLTIVQPNTYQGGTGVVAGTLFLGDGITPGAALGTGDVRVNANATFQLDLANNETFANNIVNTGHVVADDAPVSNYTISGLITGTGDFTKTGGNTVTLSHVNDYTGNTYVNQGTLLAGVGTPGGPGASGPGPFGQNSAVFVNSGGTLQLNGFNVSIAALLGSPGGIVQNSSLTPATLTLAGPFNVGYFDGIIQNGDFPFGTAIALSEPLSDAAPILTPIPGAPLSLWMAGSGFQTLAGLNTYTGTTHVTNGTLRAGISNPGGGPGAFGNNSAVTVSDSGILETTGHTVAIGSLAGNAGGIVENGAFQPGNLITGANNSSTTFAGLIRDGVFEIFQGTLVTSLSFESQTQFAPTTPAPLSITKTGTGTQILSGANTYTGGTTLREGTLAAGNAKAFGNGNLTMTGGTLMTTGGPLAVNIGAGNILFTGGTFVANVGGLLPAVQHDQLVTTGTANISGGMLTLLQQNGFVLKAGNQIVLLSAAGGVAGGTATGVAVPASQVTGLSAFSNTALLIPVVNLYTTSVILEALQGSFAGLSGFLGMTPNEIAVATALDSLVAKIGGKTGVIKELDFLDGQSFTQLLADLDKISPEELTSIFHLAKSLANVQTANIQRRLEELRSENPEAFAALGRLGGAGASGPVGKRSKAVAPAEDERWGLWFAGSGEFTQVGNRTNAAGFSLDSSGVTAGVDYRFTDHFAAGISLGYMNTTASLSNGGKIDADGGRVGAYATYFDRGFYIDAAVSGGANGYSTRRTTPNNTVATASPQGTEVNLLLATGYDWKWKGLTIGPIASFQYTNVQLNGFTETGGFAPLSVLTQNADSARTALGFHATFDKKVGRAIIRPEVRAAWQHEFGDTSYSLTSSFATLGGSAFTVAGPETGRDSLLIGAGLSVLFNDRFSIYAYYDGELLRANYSSHNISAGFRYRF